MSAVSTAAVSRGSTKSPHVNTPSRRFGGPVDSRSLQQADRPDQMKKNSGFSSIQVCQSEWVLPRGNADYRYRRLPAGSAGSLHRVFNQLR
jgi:hypothetical protein